MYGVRLESACSLNEHDFHAADGPSHGCPSSKPRPTRKCWRIVPVGHRHGSRSRNSKKTCNTPRTIPTPGRFIPTASLRCSAIRALSRPIGLVSSRDHEAKIRRCGVGARRCMRPSPIPFETSAAMILVHAAAERSSRSAAWGSIRAR
jgi:hypothetical protein